nr:ribonuclease H-like domain-containing protein [Tanacetum cinerariifolium]
MDNEVGVTIPESTIQTLLSFEEYTPPMAYPEEVEKTLGTPIEVEPLNETKLEEVGFNYNHNTPLSYMEVPSFDKPEPQPQPLPNCPPLDASLGIERHLKPPIKPQSPDSFRIKILDNLTIHTPPSSFVAYFHLRDLYCYYRPCIDDPKKHYGFKLGLLGHSGSLSVDFLNFKMIGD